MRQYVLTYFTWFSASCSDAECEQKQFCGSPEVLLSFCSTYHSVWGEHALHVHFWVCQAAQLWWPLRGEVEAWVSLHTLLWLLIFDITAQEAERDGVLDCLSCAGVRQKESLEFTLPLVEISVPWADMGGLQQWFTADRLSGTRKGLIRKRFIFKKTVRKCRDKT